jgi:hypothetical protein
MVSLVLGYTAHSGTTFMGLPVISSIALSSITYYAGAGALRLVINPETAK